MNIRVATTLMKSIKLQIKIGKDLLWCIYTHSDAYDETKLVLILAFPNTD